MKVDALTEAGIVQVELGSDNDLSKRVKRMRKISEEQAKDSSLLRPSSRG